MVVSKEYVDRHSADAVDHAGPIGDDRAPDSHIPARSAVDRPRVVVVEGAAVPARTVPAELAEASVSRPVRAAGAVAVVADVHAVGTHDAGDVAGACSFRAARVDRPRAVEILESYASGEGMSPDARVRAGARAERDEDDQPGGEVPELQLREGSSGIVAINVNGPPLRRTTLAQRSASSPKTSSGRARSRIHEGSSSSASSCPPPQPA